MLRKRGFLQPVVLIVAMVAVLVGAYLAETWLRELRLAGQADFEVAPFVWAATLSYLALAVLLVALLWYVLQSDSVGLAVFVVFLVAGGIVVANPVLRLLYGVEILPFETVLTLSHGLLITAGAFFAATGLIGLFLSLRER